MIITVLPLNFLYVHLDTSISSSELRIHFPIAAPGSIQLLHVQRLKSCHVQSMQIKYKW